MNRCAFCGDKMKSYAYVCRTCYRQYDLDTDWAKELIDAERYWRKLNKRDERFGIIDFSDLQISRDGELYDGWDLIDGEIGYGQHNLHPTNIFDEPEYLGLVASEPSYSDALQLCEMANLTTGETEAVLVQALHSERGKLKSEEAAKVLSELEGKKVSPAAFRRRLCDARKKIKDLGFHFLQLKTR
jgi:hypothetical protein